MTLDDIPVGERVPVDANILIYARRGMSVQCRHFAERCARREITGVLTTIALAEFCHRRMMQEAQSRGLASSNPAKGLSQDAGLVRQLTGYRQEVEDLLAGEFTPLGIAERDFAPALDLQHRHGLMTNDSLHLAAGLRAGLAAIATADPQFEGVTDLRGLPPHRPVAKGAPTRGPRSPSSAAGRHPLTTITLPGGFRHRTKFNTEPIARQPSAKIRPTSIPTTNAP